MAEKLSPGRTKSRKALYARHRSNVVASYNRLRAVLPEQNLDLADGSYMQVDHNIQEVLSASGSKYNRVTLVNRAKLYIMHLEDVANSLIQEASSNKAEKQGQESGQTGPKNTFKNMTDVHQNFLRNFQLGKQIQKFDFDCLESHQFSPMSRVRSEFHSTKKQAPRNSTKSLHGNSSLSVLGSAVHPAILIPINVTSGNAFPFIVEAYPTSPTSHSVDLGFVSAGNASQDTVSSDK